MTNRTLPAIVILNRNYFPDSELDAFKVGATSFALSVIGCLKKHSLLAGLILYKRNDSLTTPSLKREEINDVDTVTIHFNFSIDRDAIRNAIATAILLLSKRSIFKPMVYYQTDTLLSYHPVGIPCCVTHHGPFVEDFASVYSIDEAYTAYGSKEKVEHLLIEQGNGVERLCSTEDMYVLQHSALQKDYLVRQGVDDETIKVLTPPINYGVIQEAQLKGNLHQFLQNVDNRLLLISNVARLDYFKNLELLVNGTVELLKMGTDVATIITGGDAHDSAKREALSELVPKSCREKFFITEKLPQDQLFALFREVKGRAIFVCTSRYETLGITPLEAALSGVCTISPDLECVELSKYFPPKYLYAYSIEGLVDKVLKIKESFEYRNPDLYAHLQASVSQHLFESSLISGWGEISSALEARQ